MQLENAGGGKQGQSQDYHFSSYSPPSLAQKYNKMQKTQNKVKCKGRYGYNIIQHIFPTYILRIYPEKVLQIYLICLLAAVAALVRACARVYIAHSPDIYPEHPGR